MFLLKKLSHMLLLQAKLKSDSCSVAGYNRRFKRNSPMFLLKKLPHRLLLLAKLKSDSGFSQIFDSDSGKKTQNPPAGVDSGTLDLWSPLTQHMIVRFSARGGRSHCFTLQLRSCSKFFSPDPAPGRKFFKFDNPTTVQSPATIDPIEIDTCFYLRNDHADSCCCWNWKVTPDPRPVFQKILI